MNRATLAGIGAALRYAFPLPTEPLQWEAGGAEIPGAADSGQRRPTRETINLYILDKPPTQCSGASPHRLARG
jgi:hypothetical protein